MPPKDGGDKPIRLIKQAILDLTAALTRRLSADRLEGILGHIIATRVATMAPDAALRFLFKLDRRLYLLEGSRAVAYGGGVHTKHRHTRYHDFFVKRVGSDEKVLDVGCGNGALSRDVAELAGAMVVGIDLSEVNIADARRKHAHARVRYAVADATRDAPNGPFDVVILSNVLEHLRQRPAFLHGLGERSGARRFLVRVPLFERDWRVPLQKELGVEWRLDTTHETEYSPETFAAEIAEAGLAVTHVEYRWGEIWAELAGPRQAAA